MSSQASFSPAELALVNQLFAQYDTNKIGILTGEVAVKVFGGAKLPPTTLGEIWSIADSENNGWLSRKGVSTALRLIGWAQKGEKITADLINKPGPLAVIDGTSSVSTHNTGMSIPRSPPPASPLPPLTPQDRTKFLSMFNRSGPTDGLLTAEQARDIFVRSRLENDKLLQIWNLADTQDRGSLDSTDFIIGMYLIQAVMSGQITVLPTSLPPALVQQASGGTVSSVRAHSTGASGSYSPSANQTSFPQNRSIQPQYTGQMLQPQSTGTLQKRPLVAPAIPPRKTATPSAVGSSAFGTPSASNTGVGTLQWDVTTDEKASSDRFFDTLDTSKQGYIEGDVAVPFMLESKLSGEVLAHVWDLADLNNDGKLTREGFAVAMHLIQKKLKGGEIPTNLPPSLIPPSMRQQQQQQVNAIAASPFSPVGLQTQQAPPSELQDLFSFDEPPPSSAASAGPFNVPMQSTGSQLQQPSAFGSPFTSPSAFASPMSQDPFSSSASKDLLSDDEGSTATTHPLEDQSAEIGNTQNQLNSTNKSFTTTKNERVSVEQTLANQAAQLSALQTQLSTAKAAYETETKLLETLRGRFSTQTAEIEKSRSELITAESDLSAMRVEKAEIEGSFLRDKEEVRELNRRTFETGQQIETLKAEIEKAKKEAKQQKGLLAIAKKQLSSKEAERAKIEKELAEAQAAAAAVTQEKRDVEAELEKIANPESAVAAPSAPERTTSSDSLMFAASQALPATPDLGSPASGKSNNPFERLAKADTPRTSSPFLPFANAAVPSPSISNKEPERSIDATLDDPFGFSQAFETDTAHVVPAAESAPLQDVGAQAPMDDLASLNSTSEAPKTPTTANTEDFATPPTSANGAASPLRKTTDELMASQFPNLDGVAASLAAAPSSTSAESPTTPSMPGDFGASENATETDLGASLKEMDPEEDDSSDDEDEVPLATLKRKSTEVAADSKPADIPQTNGQAATTSFDDVFGVSPSNGEAAPAADSTKDAFGMPVTGDSTSPFAVEPAASYVASPTEAGVNAFDEAMGKISSTAGSAAAPSATPQFSFDNAFDDNFDFGSAKAADTSSSFPPAPTNGAIPTATTNGSDGFESLFVTPRNGTASSRSARPVSSFLPNVGSASTPTTASPPSAPPASAPPTATGPSFDEVFAGFDTPSPAIQLDTPATSVAPATSVPAPSPAPEITTKAPESPTRKIFPVSNSSPSQASVATSASPPPRARSPPIRTSSPKPRSSTVSSKDGHEKEKNPPTRHSKLSIRLPFGKKKKTEAPPPPPPAQFLTPPTEEPERMTTPAVDDDVEAVKQLAAMGFSRSQAVEALEKYAYDVPRALNSLLGQP